MHISDPDAFAFSTAAAAALKKRKRDVVGGGLWNQENAQGGISSFELDYQDINMLAPTPRFIADSPSSPTSPRPQWLHLQSTSATSASQKKRRILQPHAHHQPLNLRQHSGNHAQISSDAESVNGHIKKAPPPALMIPSFDNKHRDPSLLSPGLCSDEDLISPRTTTSTIVPTMAPPVLRPCHVCHRKPSTKVMLDAYADCELCGQRACYICLRECNSMSCGSIVSNSQNEDHFNDISGVKMRRDDGYLHTTALQQRRTNDKCGVMRQRKVCSCCAIEGLTDTGEEIVWCMDCVRREEMNQRMWQ